MATRNKGKQHQHEVTSRKERFLIGRRSAQALPQDIEPLDITLLEETLGADENIELLERLDIQEGEVTFVVSTTAEHADALRQRFAEKVIIEADLELDMFDQPPESWMDMARDPGLIVSSEDESEVIISVQSNATPSEPVVGSTVYLIGSLFPVKGITDASGEVTLTLLGDPVESLKGLYIKPRDSYWSLWIDNPSLSADQLNSVKIRPFSESFAGFSSSEFYPWGHTAMMAGKVKSALRGKGIKIAIIDSGLSIEHADLNANGGFDFTDDEDSDTSWRQDVVSHGTHVAGTVAALHNESGIRGFAPEADIMSFKIFPGGRFSDLIKSLDKCVSEQVDVVNLSLGSRNKSELLQQKLQHAKDNGVACIAAAGNSGDDVQYPAAFPDVLAVAAIGKFNEFPQDSYHQRQIGDHSSSDGQYFSARFTCFGDEVDVCAPGVGVLSTVPGGGYAAWDGTSMACPHVVGIAAVLLQARDDIRNMPRASERVEALFSVLKDGCESLGLPKTHQGAGMPSALKLRITQESEGGDGDSALDRLDEILAEALAIVRRNLVGESV